MAMNKNVLGALMRSKVHAVGQTENDQDYFVALAEAVIEHLTISAVINTTVSTVVATTGTAAAQAGTGTGAGVGKIS